MKKSSSGALLRDATLSLMFIVSALAASTVDAQNPDYTLSIANQTVGAGNVAVIPIQLTIASGSAGVAGWAFGVCSDPAALNVIDVVPGSTFVEPPDFFATDTSSGGFTSTVVVSLVGQETLGAGTHEIVLASYASGTAQSTSLDFCGTLGTPLVEPVLAVAPAVEVLPTLQGASIEISGTAAPGDFILQVPTRTVYYNPTTGAADFPVTLSASQTSGLSAVSGLTFAFSYDDSLCTATGANPRAILDALNGGSGPAFFGVDLVAGGVVVDIDTGTDPLILSSLQSIATVNFTCNATEMLAQGQAMTNFTFGSVTVAGTPIASNVEASGGVGSLLFSNGGATFVPSPAGGGGGNGLMALFIGAVTTSTNQAMVPVSLDNDGSVQGFSYSVCHDTAVLAIDSIEPGIDLQTANGGSPVDFFVATALPGEGWNSGVVVSFAATSTLLDGNNEVAVALYNVVDSSGGSTDLDFCEIGTPPVEIVFVIAGGVVVTPDTFGGTLSFTAPVGASGSSEFQRGDLDADGEIGSLADSLLLLNWGFIPGSPAPQCMRAADCNDDGTVGPLTDALYLLTFQFLGGSAPPLPGAACGVDPTPDALSCVASACP